MEALEGNTHVEHIDFCLPQEKDESQSSDDFDLSAIEDNILEEDFLQITSPNTATDPVAETAYLERVFARNSSIESMQVGCTGHRGCDPVQRDAWLYLMMGLQKNTSLSKLELDGGSRGDGNPVLLDTTVCYEMADYLASSSQLKELAFSNIQAETPEGLCALAAGLAGNNSLECLEFLQIEISDDSGYSDEDWAKSWSEILVSLGKIPTLKTLRFLDCEMLFDNETESFRSLFQSQSLQCFRWIDSDLSVSTIFSLADAMRGSNLKVLDLRGDGLSAAHCVPLRGLLQGCSLEKLILEENAIEDDGLASLSSALTFLRKVNLRSNMITASGCQTLTAALEHGGSLQSLDISENCIGDNGVKALCGSSLHQLRELVMESCLIAEDGIAELGSLLSDASSSLRTLSLSQNRINEDACRKLVRMLAMNKTLRSLDLSSCHITDQAVAILAKGLEKDNNCSLSRLSVAFNSFGNEGATSIGSSLPNCELESLECQFNDFNEDGLEAIVRGLSQNTQLLDLFVLNGSSHQERAANLAEEMKYWLLLNRAGRRAILDESIPLAAWPRILARADRVSGPTALFHLLQCSPGLVSVASQE